MGDRYLGLYEINGIRIYQKNIKNENGYISKKK